MIIIVDATMPVTVELMTLDTISGSEIINYETVIIKIDVEGFESDVLDGAAALSSKNQRVFFLVEYFVDNAVLRALESKGAKFLTKLTPYNSWWTYQESDVCNQRFFAIGV